MKGHIWSAQGIKILIDRDVEANVDMELSCDERVIQGTDYATRKAYTETLLSTLHKQRAKKTVLSTGFYGGKQIVKKRFKNILAKKERRTE